MKGQDIIVLLKLESLWRNNADKKSAPADKLITNKAAQDSHLFSLRKLGEELGISKTEMSRSNHRNLESGLAKKDRESGLLKVNRKALLEFLVHGVKYVFPVKPAEVVRGLPTAYAAPVLAGKVMSAGELIPVWPDASSQQMGQAIQPLYDSAVSVAKTDAFIYDALALVDAIRIGAPREAELAKKLLKQHLQVK